MPSSSPRAWIILFAVVAVILGWITLHGGRVAVSGKGVAAERTHRSVTSRGKGESEVFRNADVPPRQTASAPPDQHRRMRMHRAPDFAGARFGDAVVTDGLRLREASARGARAEASVGSYFSAVDERPMSPQEQMDETFDKIGFDCDADVPPGAAVKLEFRTIAYDEDGEGWSAWREVLPENFQRLIPLGTLAQKWQYRVTLAGRDGGNSPVVRSITVITERDPELAARTFAFAEHAP